MVYEGIILSTGAAHHLVLAVLCTRDFYIGTKTLFIPFMLDALDSAECRFIQSAVDWMLTDEKNADLGIGDISYNYLIEGNNPISIS